MFGGDAFMMLRARMSGPVGIALGSGSWVPIDGTQVRKGWMSECTFKSADLELFVHDAFTRFAL